MNIRNSLIIEFTGTPNSGKTTIINFLANNLRNLGYRVEVKKENAETVPRSIPKKTWERNMWITCGQLQSLIEIKYSEADIILLDRGFYDSMFWANFLSIQDICSKEDSQSLKNILNEMDKQFNLKPDYLFVIDVATDVSLMRRYSSGGEPVVLSTNDFIKSYKTELKKFYSELATSKFWLDTSYFEKDEMQNIVFSKIVNYLS